LLVFGKCVELAFQVIIMLIS